VHGSKGLESPVVILPETQKRRAPNGARTVRVEGMPVWRGSADECCDAVALAVGDWEQRQEEERRRLLYVAMTRAESWLIVAAAGETGEGQDSWHAMIAEGAGRAGLDTAPLEIEGIGTGQRLGFGDWPQAAQAAEPALPVHTALPDWTRQMPPNPPVYVAPVTATGLGGAKVLGAVSDGDREAAMLRGTRVHLLLEHLPHHARSDWPRLARAVLAGGEGGLPEPDELADLLAEAEAILSAPALAEVMQPEPGMAVLEEVALTAPIAGLGTLNGVVDRLIVGAARVLAVDYKTNSEVPARPEDTPEGILRQMAAYRAALRAIYPARRIEVAVLWTAARALMILPDAVLDGALPALDSPAPPS